MSDRAAPEGQCFNFQSLEFLPSLPDTEFRKQRRDSINMCTLFTQYMHLFREGNKQKFEAWFLPLRTLVAWSPRCPQIGWFMWSVSCGLRVWTIYLIL